MRLLFERRSKKRRERQGRGRRGRRRRREANEDETRTEVLGKSQEILKERVFGRISRERAPESLTK